MFKTNQRFPEETQASEITPLDVEDENISSVNVGIATISIVEQGRFQASGEAYFSDKASGLW
ncbi:hypothetical protein LQZ18_12200 [Lachnospiraceae bacterium ZAX-1]